MAFNVKKDKHGDIKKAQYYVWYLGWKECRGLGGREFTEPIVKDLVIRRRHEDLPKLTIEVGRKEIKIFQQIKGKWGKAEKIKYPTVPSKDLTYATQGLTPDEDIVACVFLGFNPTTRRAVHVHVYRCDSPDTAAVFVDHLSEIVKLPEHQERLQYIERDLVDRGEVKPRPRNFIKTYQGDGLSSVTRTPSTVNTGDMGSISSSDSDSDADSDDKLKLYTDDPIEKEKEEKMEVLAREFSSRLKMKTPILLPPTDYDTVRRAHGDVKMAKNRKSLHRDIVGYEAFEEKEGTSRKQIVVTDKANDPEIVQQPNVGDVKREHRRSTGSKDSDDIAQEQDKPDPDTIHVVSPHWKKESVFVPPRSSVSSSPPLASPVYHGSNPSTSPLASPDVLYTREPPLTTYMKNKPTSPRPVLRHSASDSQMDRGPYKGRGRSPSPRRLNGDSRERVYGSPPGANRGFSPSRKSRESKSNASSPRYVDEGPYGVYQTPPVVDDRIYSRPPDEGYRSLERVNSQKIVSLHPNGRDNSDRKSKKDKSSKKEKKQKNIFGQKMNPGDELPVDYTVGRSASFKYAQ